MDKDIEDFIADVDAEEAMPKMRFNPLIHIQTDAGDPDRFDDGRIKMKKNWKKTAEDRQGRSYNEHVHGDKPELDNEGFLKVRRRGAVKLVSGTNRTEAFIDKHHKDGYMEYLMNDTGGRMAQFLANDWEPVIDEETKKVASMKVGQAREADTTGILMRKPQEWYDADQELKRAKNKERFELNSAPDESKGQFDATSTSPLR